MNLHWECIEQKVAETTWDNLVCSFDEYSVYQGFKWGEYKKACGENIARILGKHDDEIKVMLQCVVKTLPFGCGYVWVPGGATGDLSYLNNEFKKFIRETLNIKFFVIRASFERAIKDGDIQLLQQNHWHSAMIRINSGLSLLLNLQLSADEREKNLSSNWRHNLKRSKKFDMKIEPWGDCTQDKFSRIYAEMNQFKKLNIGDSFVQNFDLLSKYLAKDLILLKCCGSDGATLSLRGCFKLGNKAHDLLAATIPPARKMYASQVLFWKLSEVCQDQGITTYDLGGVDPANNQGVYNFKKGTGAKEVKYLGEWELTNFPPLRWVMNFLIKCRKHHE